MQPSNIEQDVKKKKFLRIIPLIFVVELIAFLDRSNISYATLTMSKDLHFTATIFGFGAGIFFVGCLLFQIPVSFFAEKKSTKTLLASIVVGWGAVAVITSVINTDWQFYVFRFALGACEAGLFPALVVYVSHWFVQKERGTIISILVAATSLSLIILGPISTQILTINWMNLVGWKWLFILEGLPAIVIGPIVYFCLTDRPNQSKWLNLEERKWLEEQLALEIKTKEKKYGYTWKQALRERDVIILLVIYAFWLAASYSLVFFLPTMINELAKFPLTTIGYIVAASYAVGFAALIAVGRSSDRRNERKMHIFIPVIIGAVALALTVVIHSSVLLTIILLAIAVSASAAGYGIFWNLPTLFLSETSAAVFIGVLGTIGNIGGFVGPSITGYLRSATGSFDSSTIFIVILFLVVSFLILTLKKTQALSLQTTSDC